MVQSAQRHHVPSIACHFNTCRFVKDTNLLMLSGVLVCSLTVLNVHGLYSASDDVIELNPSNFNREVLQSDNLWLVEFYAPW